MAKEDYTLTPANALAVQFHECIDTFDENYDFLNNQEKSRCKKMQRDFFDSVMYTIHRQYALTRSPYRWSKEILVEYMALDYWLKCKDDETMLLKEKYEYVAEGISEELGELVSRFKAESIVKNFKDGKHKSYHFNEVRV